MSTVLVTGGAGYIGSHACKALKAAGHEPVTVDNLVYGHEWAVQWGPLAKGDIRDREFLDAVFKAYKPAAVMHFAAFAYVGESVTDPEKYYRNNVAGTLSLLSAMRHHDCRNIVFSSTCATYGTPERLPLTEDARQSPINPYGWSKLMMEQILRDFDHAYGITFASLRYFNAAGADPAGRVGEDHSPETHLIPLVCYAALGRRSHIEVFGADYDTPDGTCIRDYVHVDDLAAAHVAAIARLEAGGESMFLNLGTGQGLSVAEVIRAVEKASGRPVPVKYGARREGDPHALFADAARANAVLGWKPACSDIESIVQTAWRWHLAKHG
jgi:UDP-arabinose 4-epimerase